MNRPVSLLNQYAVPVLPLVKIAPRSFSDTLSTFDCIPVAMRNSSPTVVTCRLRGEVPAFSVVASPRSMLDESAQQYTFLCVARSHQSLPTTPCRYGYAPVRIVAWPTAV